ncbi:hypothetical protein FKM82_027756 [Ascaphus truei]
MSSQEDYGKECSPHSVESLHRSRVAQEEAAPVSPTTLTALLARMGTTWAGSPADAASALLLAGGSPGGCCAHSHFRAMLRLCKTKGEPGSVLEFGVSHISSSL